MTASTHNTGKALVSTPRKTYFCALAILLFLFCLRVLGQVLVAFGPVGFLPPMEQWYSGLLPYPFLLVCQILIVCLFAKICVDIGTEQGYFSVQRPIAGAFLIKFSYVYYLAMVVRYCVQMYLYPDDRWFGHTIPIVFHFVLATYLLLLGRYNMRYWSKESIPQI